MDREAAQKSVTGISLRDLPSVHEVLGKVRLAEPRLPHALVVAEIQRTLDAARAKLKRGETVEESIAASVEQALACFAEPSFRHVINATGVVLHTNLGRAPLAKFDAVTGYSNLEYNLESGQRGKRDSHIGRLLEAILGHPAIAVNNGAAALFLILNEFAAGKEVIISRGELIEIGDGFRIPEIMQRSGAILREVGTTNRTTIADYSDAINENTGLLLRVHPSNFRMTGFTARPELRELVALSKERGLPVYEDLGSGCVVDLGLKEPLVQESLTAGANLVSFSGDKLLGGPQAGIIAGDAELVARTRRNPLFRALRLDKLFYQAMETTLRHILFGELDRVPALRMILITADEIGARAEALVKRLPEPLRIEPGESVIGGGSTPDYALPTFVIVANKKESVLRANNPPVISRVERDRVLLDLRTVLPEEEQLLLQALS
jgi:L-seryl-tRNA(Ser) seleniumtransferase